MTTIQKLNCSQLYIYIHLHVHLTFMSCLGELLLIHRCNWQLLCEPCCVLFMYTSNMQYRVIECAYMKNVKINMEKVILTIDKIGIGMSDLAQETCKSNYMYVHICLTNSTSIELVSSPYTQELSHCI